MVTPESFTVDIVSCVRRCLYIDNWLTEMDHLRHHTRLCSLRFWRGSGHLGQRRNV